MSHALLERDVWSLFDASLTVNEAGLGAFLGKTLDRCTSWFLATGATLFLRDDLSGIYSLAAKSGIDRRVPADARLIPGVGIAGTCILQERAMLIGDPEQNPELKLQSRRRRDDLVSALVVPLIAPGTGCIGVLNLSRRKGEQPFSEEDLRHVSSVAQYIALAVANAKLISRINESLQESTALHEKLDTIVASLGVGIVVVNGAGHVDEANPEARKIVGADIRDQMPWQEYTQYAPAALALSLKKTLRRAMNGKTAKERAVDPENQKAWSIVARPMPSGGAAVSIEDISDSERALKELGRVKRLAEIGQMTAAIAHEIRNPLASIQGSAQLVQTSPEDAKEFGKIIEDEAHKLNSLCDEFLDFARPLELRSQEFTMSELCERLVEQHQLEFDAKKVKLNLVITSKQPKIKGDRVRLEHSIRNLMLNALQACENGDQVEVHCRKNSLVVKDTGCGMSAETIGKLFTPFFTTKSNGTGLGLSNVRKVIDAHGWRIDARSEIGIGTEFMICWDRKGS